MGFQKKFFSRLLIACLFGLALFSTNPISAAESGTEAMMENGLLIIVDSNNKKILYYRVESKGLMLKEVRSYSEALEAPNFSSSKGLSSKEESKALKKLKSKE